VPERNKKPGVCYAISDDGLELPVIDITHPAFACEVSQDELSVLIADAARDLERIKQTPPEVVREFASQPILARGWMQSVGSFMSGMITYLNRLGPENLGDGYAGPIDRRMAAGLMPVSFRFRLRDVARLIVDALVMTLAVPDDRPGRLLNIGGGPAADSLNALILVNKEHPERMSGRRISIAILDLDSEGPSFGGGALSALQARDAPLYGLDASFAHIKYDWSGARQLRTALGEIGEIGAGICSSEGGLFDYDSDEDIVANLSVLREGTPPDFIVVGSVVRDVASLDPRLRATTMPKINRSQIVLQAQIPFGELLDYYLQQFVRNPEKLAASTRAKYETHIANHIRPAWKDAMLGEIRGLEIDRWLSEKGRPRMIETAGRAKIVAGLSWNTRTDLRNIMSGIFTKAIEWGLWKDANPVTAVSVGRKKTVRHHRKLTTEETRSLLEALPVDVRLICEVALFCTLRISEVLGLQWKHIDLGREIIQVRQRFYRGDVDTVKSERSERDVPMGALARDLLGTYPGPGHDDDYVFSARPHVGAEKKARVCRDDRAINQHFLRAAAVALGVY
jgi:integrase